MEKPFHTQDIGDVVSHFQTNLETGLTSAQAKEHLERYGANKLAETKPKTLFQRFLEQIADFMIIVLLIAAAISFIVDPKEGWVEALLILLIVIVNAIIGIIQESRAEKSLEAIKKLSSPHAKVLRDGIEQVIPIEEVVVGDIVTIEAGDFVPADIRLFETHSLKIDESALTGEAVPVEKNTETIAEEDVPLGDRLNSGFMSTVVTYGRGKGIVVATGMKTEIGKIAGMLSEAESIQTPLQKSLASLGKVLAVVALIISLIVFIISYIYAETPNFFDWVVDNQPGGGIKAFMAAVSLAVAAIPEGLPAIVTVVLAIGMQNLVKQKAIMRKLPAVETLGSTNIICSDKTGTLTQNKMTIQKVYVDDTLRSVENVKAVEGNLKTLIQYGVLCNDTKVQKLNGTYDTIGDPTEIALIHLAISLNLDPVSIINAYERVYEYPFDSDRKLMTTVYSIDGQLISITKGAPDVLFQRLANIRRQDQVTPFSDKDLKTLEEANLRMANEALRVLAIAYKTLEPNADVTALTPEALEKDLTFIGLVGMIDPPREEVKDAIRLCKRAGIETIMITGDHKNTAIAIAKDLGIITDPSQAISGPELDQMSDEEFEEKIEQIRVYARVSPENKVRIVRTWRKKGKVTAMTGDGVNDAPALKSADIGVAMGITGTEVAKGAADMILTDDNFATIVNAVKEGRTIFANIKKAIFYLLSSNVGEIMTILLGSLFFKFLLGVNVGTPLTAIQILWVNLVTDSLMAIALGLENPEPNVMSKPPRDTRKSIFADGFGRRILINGILLGLASFVAYIIGFKMTPGAIEQKITVAQTMTFMTLAFSQLFHAFNARSEEVSIFKLGILSNRYLVGAFLISALLQLSTFLLPNVFNITLLTIPQVFIVLGLALIRILTNEVTKFINWKRKGLSFDSIEAPSNE